MGFFKGISDKEAYRNIKVMKQDGKTYNQVTQQLADEAIVCASGRPVTNVDASKFMSSNGYRMNGSKNRRPRTPKVTTVEKRPATKLAPKDVDFALEKIINLVNTVVQAPYQYDVKLALIRAIVA